MSKIKTTPSSGNVFADIGLQNAEELSVKAKLVVNLKRLMNLHKLTQKEVAERVGTDQPTVSKLLRGQLDLVSVEKLLNWHSALNQEVDITIRDRFTRRPAQKARRGQVSVHSCACPA
jgi:predicted XRE-type DNA-binding protein